MSTEKVLESIKQEIIGIAEEDRTKAELNILRIISEYTEVKDSN